MKKLLLLFALGMATLSSCKKGTVLSTEAEVEEAQIQAYIKTNNLTGVSKDPSGVYYKSIITGTGNYPTSTSALQVTYSGKLLDGTVFDSQSGYSIPLTSSVLGWQYGLPHVRQGGRILLIIPSALGYGRNATSSIPANSVLIFTIDLLGIQ